MKIRKRKKQRNIRVSHPTIRIEPVRKTYWFFQLPYLRAFFNKRRLYAPWGLRVNLIVGWKYRKEGVWYSDPECKIPLDSGEEKD